VEAITGYTAAEYLARPTLWVERLHPLDRERVQAEMQRMLAGGERLVTEYRVLGKDDRVRWVRDEAAVVGREPDGRCLIQGVCADVTRRREAEEEAARAQRQLEAQAETLARLQERERIAMDL